MTLSAARSNSRTFDPPLRFRGTVDGGNLEDSFEVGGVCVAGACAYGRVCGGPPSDTPDQNDNPGVTHQPSDTPPANQGTEHKPDTPGPRAGLPAKARAYGRFCKDQSKKRSEAAEGTQGHALQPVRDCDGEARDGQDLFAARRVQGPQQEARGRREGRCPSAVVSREAPGSSERKRRRTRSSSTLVVDGPGLCRYGEALRFARVTNAPDQEGWLLGHRGLSRRASAVGRVRVSIAGAGRRGATRCLLSRT